MTCVRVFVFIDCDVRDGGLRLKFEPWLTATVEIIIDMMDVFQTTSTTGTSYIIFVERAFFSKQVAVFFS